MQAMERLSALGPRLAADPLATDLFGAGPLVQTQDVNRFYAQATEILLSPESAARFSGAVRRGRLPRATWWQDIERAAVRPITARLAEPRPCASPRK